MTQSTVKPGKLRAQQNAPIERWRTRNLYYYQDIEKFYCYLLQPQARVLEVGSGLGYLLAAVKSSRGVGIDPNPVVVEYASSRFPHLEFQVDGAEHHRPTRPYDYLLMANTLSYLDDIQQAFQALIPACTPSTRVVLTFHNPAWEPILKLAEMVGQRMPLPPLNWLSQRDVANLLNLSGYEVVFHTKRLLLPKRILLLSWLVNTYVAPLPLINRLCLVEHMVARLQPQTRAIAPVAAASPATPLAVSAVSQATCSIIIPARNEAGNIESCITRLPQMGRHTEIIFVEGHSSDHTWDEILRVQQMYGDRYDIKAYQQTGKGKGNAVRLGFEQATGDVLIILDSDLTVAPEDLPYFFAAVASGTCELANGCRLVYPVSAETMPWLNCMANRFFAALLSYLLNTKIKDSLCGTKAILRSSYHKLVQNRSYFGDFDPFGDFDLLFGAAKLGLKIQDVPVRYRPRTYGSSNIQHVKEGMVLLRMCHYAASKMKFI